MLLHYLFWQTQPCPLPKSTPHQCCSWNPSRTCRLAWDPLRWGGGRGLAISAGDNNTLCHHNLQHCQNLHQALLLALLLIKHRNHRLVCKEVYAKTKNYTYGTIKYGFLAASGEPSNLEDALHDKNWKHAMDDEYEALIKNKT
jgi:hypothetical protein